ncbi:MULTISPECIES: amidohydrolase family protein [unclassified Nocardia]|uniref:amidohydrolase family protein n=1 Tax=unclassified Nocardia TaxID=2637762 RepID=UPI001CE480F4|nr:MULTISPECIES: amidohydrolase family protein [unclassified Nocardia]
MSDFVIHDVRVFDGALVLPPTSVLVRAGRIAEVGADVAASPEAERIDGTGHTLLPGLIDAHAHAFPGSLEQALKFGVTTVLDLLSDPTESAKLRAEAERRTDLADLRTAGTGATVPGGYPWWLVEAGYIAPFPTLTDPDEAETFVAARVAEGSDYLKILMDDGITVGTSRPTLRADTVRALTDAAHGRDLLALAHTLTEADTRTAVAAGIDGLAHVFVDRQASPEVPEMIAAQGVFVIPTLIALRNLFETPDGAELLDDPRVAPYLDEQSRAGLAWPAYTFPETARNDLAAASDTVGRLRAAGVSLLAGSDANGSRPAHGIGLHRELKLLVTAGLSPTEALHAATAAPAQRFGLADRGRIAPGLRADLLLVSGDPCRNIDATLDIAGIWRGGEYLYR